MRSFFAAALSLVVLGGLPLAVHAQTVPCISCDIAEQNAAIQAATNRAIVQQQLQSDLQTRLGTQQLRLQNQQLQNQQLLNTLQLQSSLNQNDWALRQILLQEQINILRLEARQRALKAKKPHPHSAAPRYRRLGAVLGVVRQAHHDNWSRLTMTIGRGEPCQIHTDP